LDSGRIPGWDAPSGWRGVDVRSWWVIGSGLCQRASVGLFWGFAMGFGNQLAVYLAGPINGCTDEEAKGWRDQMVAGIYVHPTVSLTTWSYTRPGG
jgi:hypothetical protein